MARKVGISGIKRKTETLAALSISAATNPAASAALEQLAHLVKCDLVSRFDINFEIRVDAPVVIDVSLRCKRAADGSVERKLVRLLNRSSGIPNQPN